MPDHSELTGVALVVVGALVCGLLMTRFRQPAVIGYIFAGILLGPSGFGFVGNREQVAVLAELGVLMLLFLIGMELSLRSFARVWRVALPATALQVAISMGVVLLISQFTDWPIELAVLIAFAISISSTAVAIKMLEDIGELRTDAGATAVGVLVAQDLAVVPMLLVIGAMAGDGGFGTWTIVKIVGAIALLVVMIRYLAGRKRLSLPFARAVIGNHDLEPLMALAYCFAAAALTGVLGLSNAYGAFLAGLFVGNSTERAPMHTATQPIQSILLMVFFLSIGLLIDLGYIWENLLLVAFMLLLVAVLKTAMNVGILHVLGEPWRRAFLAGVVLAQIGEFSFILAAAGAGSGLIDDSGYRLLVAVIALSLAISPLWNALAHRLHNAASRGMMTFGELLDELYGHEAAVLAESSSRAARVTQRVARLASVMGRRRARRLLRRGSYLPATRADVSFEAVTAPEQPRQRPAVTLSLSPAPPPPGGNGAGPAPSGPGRSRRPAGARRPRKPASPAAAAATTAQPDEGERTAAAKPAPRRRPATRREPKAPAGHAPAAQTPPDQAPPAEASRSEAPASEPLAVTPPADAPPSTRPPGDDRP